MSQSWIDIAAADAIPLGGYRIFELDAVPVAVFNVSGELFAIQDICTHDGATLTGGPVEGDEIICPRHGARFCLRTGAVLSPPAYEPVRSFPLRIENGRLLIQAEP